MAMASLRMRMMITMNKACVCIFLNLTLLGAISIVYLANDLVSGTGEHETSVSVAIESTRTTLRLPRLPVPTDASIVRHFRFRLNNRWGAFGPLRSDGRKPGSRRQRRRLMRVGENGYRRTIDGRD